MPRISERVFYVARLYASPRMRPQYKFLFKTPKVWETPASCQATISYITDDIEDAENWINKALARTKIFSLAQIEEFKNFQATSFKGSTVVKKIEIPRVSMIS